MRIRLSLVLPLLLAAAVRSEEPSFRNHIVPILTKAGCNSGATRDVIHLAQHYHAYTMATQMASGRTRVYNSY